MLQSPTAHPLQLEQEINKVRRGFMNHLCYHLLRETLKSKPIWHWLRVRLPEAVKGKGKLFRVTSSKIEFNPSDPTYVISQKPSIKGHRTFWRKSQGMSLAYPFFWLTLISFCPHSYQVVKEIPLAEIYCACYKPHFAEWNPIIHPIDWSVKSKVFTDRLRPFVSYFLCTWY